MYHLFSGEPIKEIEMRYLGKGYKQFKEDLAEAIIATLKPLRKSMTNSAPISERLKSILRTPKGRSAPCKDDSKAAVGLSNSKTP